VAEFFDLPGPKKIISSNITPDKETGIGYWTEDAFVNKFKSLKTQRNYSLTIHQKDYQSIMPGACMPAWIQQI
jgi:hypothetical protein